MNCISTQASEDHVYLQIPSHLVSFSLDMVLVALLYKKSRCFTLTSYAEILFLVVCCFVVLLFFFPKQIC